MKVICSSLLGCLLSASLLACNPAATPKEKQMIEELTSQMKRLCMGRFVMSVPKEMALGGYVTLFFGLDEDYKTVKVQTESFDATPESMRREMDAKAKEIDEDDKNWKTKKSMLLEYRIASDRAIYLRQHDDPISAAASKHELHLLVGKTQLVLKAESYEGVPGAGYYSPDGKVETPEQVAARLFKIAGQIRAVEDPEKAGPGFCM